MYNVCRVSQTWNHPEHRGIYLLGVTLQHRDRDIDTGMIQIALFIKLQSLYGECDTRINVIFNAEALQSLV